MTDIKLNAAGNDIDLINGGELVTGVDAIVQHMLIRLRFFKGEYFLNLLLGFPYYQDVFRKAPKLVVVRSLFREVIRETPGVLDITAFELTTTTDRLLTLRWTVIVDGSDDPLNFTEPFLIGDDT